MRDKGRRGREGREGEQRLRRRGEDEGKERHKWGRSLSKGRGEGGEAFEWLPLITQVGEVIRPKDR